MQLGLVYFFTANVCFGCSERNFLGVSIVLELSIDSVHKNLSVLFVGGNLIQLPRASYVLSRWRIRLCFKSLLYRSLSCCVFTWIFSLDIIVNVI